MNGIKLFGIVFFIISTAFVTFNEPSADDLKKTDITTDSLPAVLISNHADLIESRLRNQAILNFGTHHLPESAQDLSEWKNYSTQLKRQIIEKAGIVVDHQLPLNIREIGSTQMKGYTIKNIAFQASPGTYATANLYVPEGKGPFPAAIIMHGHWPAGRLYESFQAISQTLALNGYVALNMDAYGAGERTTIQGKDEYHGANLGASLMNVGESLMGLQVVDNIRGVDLLSSLSYVDAKHIGATGASGGGNQTMWLAALDERIKAAVTVVSVGTFESYIMRSNCICELLPDGMTMTEEAGILAMIAPRALKICNNIVDNPTFVSSEMLRSYNNARPVFKMFGVENNISNTVLNKTHGYWPENREALLGWFDLHLKGTGDGAPKKEIPFETLPNEQLLVYPAKGSRPADVEGVAAHAKRIGAELRTAYLNKKIFDVADKKKELRDILRINEPSRLKKVYSYANLDGWDRLALETTDGKLIPVLRMAPLDKTKGYVIVCHPQGKQHIPLSVIEDLKKKGAGIAIVDLYGSGEASSKEKVRDKNMVFHTLSRAELWLGRTVMGEWVKELGIVSDYLKATYNAKRIGIDGSKEAGLAGLFLSASEGKADYLILREAPLSYLFDDRESVDFYSMAIHLPGFLKWGDVSLAAALSGKDVTMINPLTMSGRAVTDNKLQEYKTEFEAVRKKSKQPGKTVFN